MKTGGEWGEVPQGKSLEFSITLWKDDDWIVGSVKKTLEELDQIGAWKSKGYGRVELESLQLEIERIREIPLRKRIRVEFISPTILLRDKALVQSPTLYDMVVEGYRKLSYILSVYHGNEIKFGPQFMMKFKDISPIIEKIERVSFNRYSMKRKRIEKITGIIGSATYEIPLLDKEEKMKTAEVLGFLNAYGCGKRVSAGLGEVKVSSY